MEKPLIGVSPLIDYEKESLWMLPGYMDGIEEAGGLAIMLPLTKKAGDIKRLCAMCDGFLFTGGQDVCPEFYGEKRLPECAKTSRARDEMEAILLEFAMAKDKSILGICRGIQFINAALGGRLYQDLPSQYESATDHHQSPPYDIPAHENIIIENTPLYFLLEDLLDGGRLKVNSYHHSAVKVPAESLSVCAVSSDGIIEGLYDSTKSFLLAIQWHPEFSHKTDEASRRIFKAFVNSCRRP